MLIRHQHGLGPWALPWWACSHVWTPSSWKAQNCMHYLRWGCSNVEYTGTISSFDLSDTLGLIHARVQLAFLATRHTVTLHIVYNQPKLLDHFFAGLESGLSSQYYMYILDYTIPDAESAFILVKFLTVGDSQHYNLPQFFCKASLPSRESGGLHILVLPASLLKVHSAASSRSLIKTSKRTGTKMEPWEPWKLATIQKLLHLLQLFVLDLSTNCSPIVFVYMFSCMLNILSRRILWETVSKAEYFFSAIISDWLFGVLNKCLDFFHIVKGCHVYTYT